MPASVSAGDLLLVALKMPPSRIGTYSNFAPVRFSIAGIASWLRKAFGLPKSNMNCGFWLTAISPKRLLYDPYHSNQPSGSSKPDQPEFSSVFWRKPRQHVVDRAAKIDLDQRAGAGIENQDRCMRMPPKRRLCGPGDLAQIARGDAAVSLECDIGDFWRGIHGNSSIGLDSWIYY